MSVQVQRRGGGSTTTPTAAAYVGPKREIIVDEDVWGLRVHDGTTPGGHLVGGIGFTNDTVATGVAAAGSNQSGATAVSKQQNYVTGASGTNGVKIAAAVMVAGAHIFITNEDTTNDLLVYPDSGVSINSLSANAPITCGPDTTLHFIMKSTTQLRSVP